MIQNKTLDFRTVVEGANRSMHRTSVILGFLTCFAIIAMMWLSLFALDNLLNLPTSLRFPLSIAGVIITIASFVKYALGALFERRSDEEVALMLEEKFGIEENVLINSMQFEDMGYSDKQKAFIAATATAATTGWSHISLRELWQVVRVTKWAAAFAVLLGLWIAYWVMEEDYLKSAFDRYAFSFSDKPPAAASLLDIDPKEDVTIAEYKSLILFLRQKLNTS